MRKRTGGNGDRLPGPKPDTEGQKRIAELLSNKPEWQSDLGATCELLTNPPGDRPGPKVSSHWRKKYNVATYAEAFRKIPWLEVCRNIERRIYQGKCLNGTIEHRATRPKRSSYTLRELKTLMCNLAACPDRAAWREMIREGFFDGGGVSLLHIDLVEGVARETLQRSRSPGHVKAWNITPELVEACERIVAITSKVPRTLRTFMFRGSDGAT